MVNLNNMSKNELSYLLLTYLFNFEKEFINTVNTDEKESIHEMRVAIKRIRSILVLLKESKICKRKTLKRFRQVYKVFDISGDLREYQIKLELLEKYKLKLNHKYENFQQSVLRMFAISKERYWNEMKKISLIEVSKGTELLKKQILRSSNRKLNKSIKKFIIKRLFKSCQWLEKENFRDYLHDIRKYLKDIRFITEQLDSITSEIFKTSFKFKDIKKVEDLLGNWHDLDLFLGDVSKYKRRKTGFATGIYDDLMDRIKSDLREMEMELHPILSELFSTYLNIVDAKC